MLNKILYSLTILSMILLLVSCGTLRKSRDAGVSDMEENKGLSEADKEARAWEKFGKNWDQASTNPFAGWISNPEKDMPTYYLQNTLRMNYGKYAREMKLGIYMSSTKV